ncbi:tRNA synthetases class II family protein [[Clostridium] sordellii ATCC 9714]|nr:tRNA synthetases class II family protein [[Clostridium] sordellii ATCC 9714] [Paeniclostridium sordellii ATCC 9714]
MEKLYYKDQYIKEFTAEIVDIKEKDSKFYVELDKTAFFPGGGGQFCDTGKIDNHDVIDVCEENGIYII